MEGPVCLFIHKKYSECFEGKPGGFPRLEPALSGACCARPDLIPSDRELRIKAEFRVELTYPSEQDTTRPLTDFIWSVTHPLPLTAGHLRQEQMARMFAARTGLSLPVGSAVKRSPD